ncbi:hypothetical protein [Cupriavidus pauculus]|uniref:hypothetical protein n=1 Tax=Cupriavidus pauculus TaxID=82633 RepID=UPI001EE2D37B|nr:hypothetical protein [Cupriavidus pauculus]GJG95421.1 hypothetical protein CBA19C6_13050 [Cupriavidus pauculus]
MKRLFASFLLCFAMFALPVQGAVAAAMMVCSVSEAAGLSMPERHAAIKAVAEAEATMDHAGNMDHAHCQEATASDSADVPVWHDAQPNGATHDSSTDRSQHAHHAAGHCSACGACAAGAMLLPEIPLVALQHHRHSLPLASPVSFASQASLPADRPPARHC